MSLSFISTHLLPFDGDQLGKSGTRGRHLKPPVRTFSQSHKAFLNFNIPFSYDEPAGFIGSTAYHSLLSTGISFVGMGHIGRHTSFKKY